MTARENIGRDGKPKRNGLLQALEVDAVEILRNRASTVTGMRDRLNARFYLLEQGWTAEQINEARDRKEAAEAGINASTD